MFLAKKVIVDVKQHIRQQPSPSVVITLPISSRKKVKPSSMKTWYGKTEKVKKNKGWKCPAPGTVPLPALSARRFCRAPGRSWHYLGTSTVSTHSRGRRTLALVCIAQSGTPMTMKSINCPSMKHSKCACGSSKLAQPRLVALPQQPPPRAEGQLGIGAQRGVLPSPGLTGS